MMEDELEEVRNLATSEDENSAVKLLQAMGADGAKWAAAFCAIMKKQGIDIDEGTMIGWFCNAIEHSWDVRTATGPVVLPDGSAFFVS